MELEMEDLAHLPIIGMHVATELVEHEVRWFL